MRERRGRGCEKEGVLGEHGEAYADERIATFLPDKAAWLQLEKESPCRLSFREGFWGSLDAI